MAQLRASLDEHEVVLLGLVLPLLCRNFPLVIQVRLIPHKNDDDVVAALCPNVVYPLPRVLEGLGV